MKMKRRAMGAFFCFLAAFLAVARTFARTVPGAGRNLGFWSFIALVVGAAYLASAETKAVRAGMHYLGIAARWAGKKLQGFLSAASKFLDFLADTGKKIGKKEKQATDADQGSGKDQEKDQAQANEPVLDIVIDAQEGAHDNDEDDDEASGDGQDTPAGLGSQVQEPLPNADPEIESLAQAQAEAEIQSLAQAQAASQALSLEQAEAAAQLQSLAQAEADADALALAQARAEKAQAEETQAETASEAGEAQP